MNLNKLKKIIEKEYYNNDQRLYITVDEVMNGKDHNLDVELCDKYGKQIQYLFEITNYNIFYEQEIRHFYFKDMYVGKGYWDGCRASYMPLYLDRVFYLKKFETITSEDIKNATDYFLHEILDLYFVFNIEFKETYENENCVLHYSNCKIGCNICPYNKHREDPNSLSEQIN